MTTDEPTLSWSVIAKASKCVSQSWTTQYERLSIISTAKGEASDAPEAPDTATEAVGDARTPVVPVGIPPEQPSHQLSVGVRHRAYPYPPVARLKKLAPTERRALRALAVHPRFIGSLPGLNQATVESFTTRGLVRQQGRVIYITAKGREQLRR